MLPQDELREADLYTSAVLAVLGAGVIVGACRMPMGGVYAGMPMAWYTSPGFFPLVLGVLLVAGAVVVFVRSWRSGAHRRLPRRIPAVLVSAAQSPVARRFLIIWVLLLGYVLCLAWHPFAGLSQLFAPASSSPWTAYLAEPEGANYVIASFAFLVLFMYAFYHRPRASRSWKRLALVVAIGLLFSWGVGYVFTRHLYSPLPW
jgi:hypothetical protein